MRAIFLLLTVMFSYNAIAQGECQMVYESHHFVTNSTQDTVSIWVDYRDQENFPTDGPHKVLISPKERIEVSDLGWAEEFRDPTQWYIFKVEPNNLTGLCDPINWSFKRLSETQGEYDLELKIIGKTTCVSDNQEMFNRSMTPSKEIPELSERIYDFANPEAEFPGGPSSMQKWIMDNVRYPQAAIEDSISGKVYIQFVVEKTGNLSTIKIMRSPHEILSNEAIRLIKSMPKWEPGMINGEAVRMRYALPIVFRIG